MTEGSAPVARSISDYEAELKAANEVVYKHSLELARLKQALEVVNAQQENLLHFISHEIKGYLTKSAAGFSGIIEGDYGVIAPQLKDMATSALSDVRQGVDTVMQILDSSNLKSGAMSFKKSPFDFHKTTASMIERLDSMAREKGLHIEKDFASGVNYTVNGDEEKIRQNVIRNIIENAILYSKSGTIIVNLSRIDGKIRFSVKDSGVGITPEDMARLFTEGGHGKDSIKTNVHSTGYGLFIAKQVLDAHGGKIWAESEGEGKGAKFVVEFPIDT